MGLGLLLLSCVAESKREAPTAVNGVIDLSDWDFERDGPVELIGEWFFASMVDIGTDFPNDLFVLPQRVNVPGYWNQYQSSDGEVLPIFGYGSYALKVMLPAQMDETLGLSLGSIYSAGLPQSLVSTHQRLCRLSRGAFVESQPSARIRVHMRSLRRYLLS